MTAPESNEMATLPSPSPVAAAAATTTTAAEPATTTPTPVEAAPTTTTTTTTTTAATPPADTTATTATSIPDSESIHPAPTASTLHRAESSAIGAASDDTASAIPKPDADAGPTVLITLLLTTGKRHPYKIDAKYLRKRNVTVEDNDPYNLPVQTLKELILRDWREDWEEKPNSPSAIRLISMGLELQEGEQLRDKRFNATGPNIVHMVIKRELPEDEEIKDSKKNRSEEEGGRRSSNCCGCVIL